MPIQSCSLISSRYDTFHCRHPNHVHMNTAHSHEHKTLFDHNHFNKWNKPKTNGTVELTMVQNIIFQSVIRHQISLSWHSAQRKLIHLRCTANWTTAKTVSDHGKESVWRMACCPLFPVPMLCTCSLHHKGVAR